MRTNHLMVVALLVGAVAVALAGISVVRADEEEEGEQSISWADVPPLVQAALNKGFPGIEFTEIERETEHGVTSYEAECEIDGKEHEVAVTEDGWIIETEEEIASSALPPAVMERIRREYPNAEIEEAERVVLTVYEVELKADGKQREIRLLANGRVLGRDED